MDRNEEPENNSKNNIIELRWKWDRIVLWNKEISKAKKRCRRIENIPSSCDLLYDLTWVWTLSFRGPKLQVWSWIHGFQPIQGVGLEILRYRHVIYGDTILKQKLHMQFLNLRACECFLFFGNQHPFDPSVEQQTDIRSFADFFLQRARSIDSVDCTSKWDVFSMGKATTNSKHLKKTHGWSTVHRQPP